MSYTRYENYSDSGVDWLRQVPSHWSLNRLGRYFDERREKVSDVDYPPLSVTKNGVVPQLDTAAKSDDSENRKKVLAGDFVINSRSDRKGSSGLSSLDGSVSLINTVLTPWKTISGKFAHYLLRSSVFQDEFYRFGKGIVADLWSTNFGEMRNILLAVPPLSEQEAIASFLDHEVAKLDSLVEAQRRLIKLLKEKRQAAISHAVTKGIVPTAAMKESGVPWLGRVPATWQVLTVGRIIDRIEQGWSPQAYERPPESGEVSVLRLSAVKDGNFQPDQRKALPDLTTEELAGAPLLRGGDFLLTRANTPDLVGDCAIATDVEATIFSDLVYRLSFSCSAALPEFMLRVFRAAQTRAQIKSDARGSSMTMAKLSHGHIKGWWIALPSIAEQQTIVKELTAQTKILDHLAAQANRAIELLSERRAALISAAVTGKIDVRETATKAEAA